MELGNDHYPTLPDLRQLIAGRNPFPAAAAANPQFITAPANYFVEGNMLFSHHQRAPSASTSNFQEAGLMVRFNDNNYSNNNHYFSPGGGGGGAVEMESSATTSGGYWSSVIGINSNDNNNIYGGGSGGNNRWPVQETLCLLEIRSRLHSKFKEANHKGPLWDELSRIMSEEHGYNRSGKKCKEKFENLYKYYKKTKEGKSGRQDGKNYRFFRQLEALFGSSLSPKFITQHQPNSLLLQQNPSEITTNPPQIINTNNHISTTLSNFSNTSIDHFETSSSTNHNYNDPFHHHHHRHDNDLSAIALLLNKDHHHHHHRHRRRHHDYHYNTIRSDDGRDEKETDVREIMESHMNKLLETQETWMERLMTTVEDNERDRSRKEEEWRKEQNATRVKEQDELRGKEKAWSEARGSALMEILEKFPTISSHHDKKTKKKKTT